MYNHQNGFESIAEFLNIICLGHLCVVASKDIDPCTEVVMDSSSNAVAFMQAVIVHVVSPPPELSLIHI